MDDHTKNMLLSLAWLWMADADHIRRLHYPALALKSVKNKLTRLRDQNLIQSTSWATGSGPALAMWSLTDAGYKLVAGDDAPKQCRPRDPKWFAHDKRTIDTIVRIIERARDKGLSSIQVWREIVINPKATRPKSDAVLIFEVGGNSPPDTVPWSRAPRLAQDAPWRICIETDNRTQSMPTIAKKARAYEQLHTDEEWRQAWAERFGPPAVTYFITDTDQRAEQIARMLDDEWNEGHWAVGSDETLPTYDWYYHLEHEVAARKLRLIYLTPAELATRKARQDAERAKREAERKAREEQAAAEKRAREQAELAERQRLMNEELARRAAEAEAAHRRRQIEERDRLAREAERRRLAQIEQDAKWAAIEAQRAAEARQRRHRKIIGWVFWGLLGVCVAVVFLSVVDVFGTAAGNTLPWWPPGK